MAQTNVTCNVSTWPRAIALVRWLVGHGLLRLARLVPIAHAQIDRHRWLVRWRPGSSWLDPLPRLTIPTPVIGRGEA